MTQIVKYQDEIAALLDDKRAVWLTADQIAALLDVDVSNVYRHVTNFKRVEATDTVEKSVAKFATDSNDARTATEHYSVDVLVYIAYRMNRRETNERLQQFRRWVAQLVDERVQETANPELGMQRSERRYLDNQQKRGMTEAQALQALADRRDGKRDFRLLMEAVQAVCIDNPNYGALVNTEYRELFGMVASQLKAVLETDSIRDALPPLQYSYIRTAELNMRELLKASDRLTFEQVQRGMQHICTPLGRHLREMCEVYQIDHVTGRPLLAGGVS